MTISVGEQLPSGKLWMKTEDGVQEIDTDEFFANKKVVVFALPGAFTPTCSAKHLPGYVQHAQAFFDKGVDAIICLSVNDAFVMDAWGKDQKVDGKVMMVADGNADFSKALGLSMDVSARGMGIRSQRYSMLVENGVVKLLNVEEPGAFEVSGAETMLRAL
ncbi:MAG: peroxiredoxin [Pseudomonadota bacterium]|uniref:peroxiredoxin n=1 Tax=Fodinicurvata fenggangensis TaxID=1121830 RepID=UPI00047EA2B5|nr:peroxiredoxin [Fodinicurvata fenggangensis]